MSDNLTYDAEHDMWFSDHPFEDETEDENSNGFWQDFKAMRFRCWWSKYFYDIHDHTDDPEGAPVHFVTFTCRYCGKKFRI